MSIVTISSKFQIVIPKSVREKLNLRPGQKVMAIPYQGRIELVPVRSMRAARGFLKGIDARVERESDRA